jgi:hypothetical protein
MKKLFLFLAVFCFFSLGLALAAEPTEIDPAIVNSILVGGLLGFGVIAVTQILKTLFHVQGGVVVFGISLAVSAAATIIFLITGGGGFTILKFVGYTVAVWAVANGWYKFKAA